MRQSPHHPWYDYAQYGPAVQYREDVSEDKCHAYASLSTSNSKPTSDIYIYIYIYIFIFDRGGALVKGVTEKVGPMPVVCGGTGSEVIGGAPPDPSWDW